MFTFKHSHLDFPTKLVNFDQTSGSGAQRAAMKKETHYTYCRVCLICQNDFLFFGVPSWLSEECSFSTVGMRCINLPQT